MPESLSDQVIKIAEDIAASSSLEDLEMRLVCSLLSAPYSMLLIIYSLSTNIILSNTI